MEKQPPQKVYPKGKIAIVVLAIVAVIGAVVSFLGQRPTDVRKLSTEFPAIEDRTGRKESRPGRRCRLTEVRIPNDSSCVPGAGENGAFSEEQVLIPSSVPDKGIKELKGTLTLPKPNASTQGGRRAAVILLHGSGPTDRDGNAPGDLVSRVPDPFPVLKSIAEVLAAQGLIVLRWDKRHCLKCYPETKPDPKSVSWLDLERDAFDALNFLKTRDDVDPTGLVVAGHSEGGHLAPHVATSYEGGPLAAVMMLAGVIDTFDVAFISQLRRFADVRRRQWDFIGAWQIRRQADTYAKCFALIPSDPQSRTSFCLGIPYGAWTEFIDYGRKTEERILNLSPQSSLFVLQGSVDRNIDPNLVPTLRRRLGEESKARRRLVDYELHYVPEVNHLLLNVIHPTHPATLDASVKARIVTFVSSVKR